MTYTIKAVELSHSYSDNLVLENVSLKVRPGEIFGLLGPSGAGKTTLIKILTGQLIQKAGYAELLGMDTKKLRDLERSKISAMMDTYGLYERLSVYDNLSFYADIYHVPRSRIINILSNLGLYEARKIPASKLSKGMKSRLSLARALLNNADVLFLDEPTSGVDPTTAREIHSALKQQKEKGTTIFLTTHNMFEAESLCDYIALLSNGNIVEQGTPAEICKKYNYLNRIEITLKNGDRVSIANESASAGLLKGYLENEDIETIHSTEPTLETVFVELTGKALSGYE